MGSDFGFHNLAVRRVVIFTFSVFVCNFGSMNLIEFEFVDVIRIFNAVLNIHFFIVESVFTF